MNVHIDSRKDASPRYRPDSLQPPSVIHRKASRGAVLFVVALIVLFVPFQIMAAAPQSAPVQSSQPSVDTQSKPVVLKIGAKGDLVTALQRTLNARLDASPELKVDGEFSDTTEEAVKKFQASRQLPASGEVGRETWQALGVLVWQDPPVPEPDVINNQTLTQSPPAPLDGPPLVTCKAWAIGDGKTGDLLWGHDADTRLGNASTTKIMTAYLVAKLAEEDPKVLDETVTFSRRADETIGSTADLKEGEKISAGELLYGLLLPSGNDASVAFAEHFGDRFEPVESSNGSPSPEDNYNRFVAAMNRAAAELGLKNTSYRNPNGLTHKEHYSSARDLLRLGWTAMQCPLLRPIFATRQHGTEVTSVSGYRRNVLWKNTNHLLPIEGFDGVKTGTTQQAGACLVSSGHRGDDHLMVVVLGATSGDARYVDSRNLYRWAWRQRDHGSATSSTSPASSPQKSDASGGSGPTTNRTTASEK